MVMNWDNNGCLSTSNKVGHVYAAQINLHRAASTPITLSVLLTMGPVGVCRYVCMREFTHMCVCVCVTASSFILIIIGVFIIVGVTVEETDEMEKLRKVGQRKQTW